MTFERQKELLDMVVDHVCVARDTEESIQKLLSIGFTAEELEHDFNFSHDDILDAEENMNEYEDD